ncbi:MAG: signal peptidase I, partial [Chlamydiia bacterium]|nr:signal peptidase I [Chlamydiia bacterium]
YQKKAKKLDSSSKEKIELQLATLKTAIQQKELSLATRIVQQLTETLDQVIPNSFFEKSIHSVLSIGIALLVAIVIRTMWFEPYTIPTGSMRPTLKEGDFLVVSKTDFGLNVPLRPAHFYFDPSLIQRGSIVVFSAENIDIADADTTYFYLFPGKKLFVKRLIGKPGDTLYFYGGKIYGVDRKGNELTQLRDAPWAQDLEHIPFIRFDGKVETGSFKQGIFQEATFYQMNQPVAKLRGTPFGTVLGEMLTEKNSELSTHYSDLWGFKHFAMARLLTPDQAKELHPRADLTKDATLYLELAHHPSLQGGSLIRDEQNRFRPNLGFNVSLLPITNSQVKELARHLTTCRFIVKNGIAHRYGMNLPTQEILSYLPELSDVPDGTYEIEKGKAYQLLWGSTTKELPADHPLYRDDPERVQLLYNLGIEFINSYSPSKNYRIYPSRYAYFRNNDLYLCGSPIVKKDDPNLILFLQSEYQKQSISTSVRPYFPFEDTGPPIGPDGKIDLNFIRKHGLVVPEKMYLALGDNHAMSADSRQFGFVPEDNLRGGPSFLFWPPGSRFGALPQPLIPHLTFPNLFVWVAAIAIAIFSSYRTQRKFTKL